MNIEERDHVTAAWIARQAGVGRAAVANWRKRYPDFPQPVAGGANSPLFSWRAVRQWLVDTGKADQLAASGRTGTGTQRIGDASPPPADEPDRALPKLEPWELLARVLVSLLPRLGDGDPPDDDVEPPVVLDPACSDATVLTAVVERFGDHVRLACQVPDELDAATVRRTLPWRPPELGDDVRVGDALRIDRFAASRGAARAVLCVPPPAARHWPATELAADPRWRFGLPDPGDPELAWVQHCVAHLRPHGVAVVVMSPVAGVRPSGRHVRAALVRAGVLRDVIALPAGLTRSGEGTAHVWVLERGGADREVRMVDLTALADVADVPRDHAGWEGLFSTDDPSVVRSVPELELRDEDMILVPSRYLSTRSDATAADLGRVTARLRDLYADLGRTLPQPVPPQSPPRHAEVTLAELERSLAITILPRDATPRAGDLLFRTMGKDPVVADRHARRRARRRPGSEVRHRPARPALRRACSSAPTPIRPRRQHPRRSDPRRRAPLPDTPDAVRRATPLWRGLPTAARPRTRRDAPGRRHRRSLTQTVHGLTTGALDPPAVTNREHRRLPVPRAPYPENEKRTQ